MHLMYYTDENGKRIYTLKARASPLNTFVLTHAASTVSRALVSNFSLPPFFLFAEGDAREQADRLCPLPAWGTPALPTIRAHTP